MHRLRLRSGIRISARLVALLCLVSTAPARSSAQITFQRIYGSTGRDEARSVVVTPDGAYVIAGTAESSVGHGSSDVYLFKIDSIGNILWERFLGGSSPDSGSSVQQTSDGGFIVTGSTQSLGAGALDMYLVKTDSAGILLWEETYGGPAVDCASSVHQTSDGGYVVAGWTWSTGSGWPDMCLVKTDSVGDELWTRTYGGEHLDEGYSVQEVRDGGYIVAGKICSLGMNRSDIYLVRTDSLGDTLWTSTPGDTGSSSDYDKGLCVTQTSDGSFLVCGYARSFGRGPCLVKSDSLGQVVWAKSYGGSSFGEGRDVVQTPDGGYIMTGARDNAIALIRTDASGDTLWTRRFGGSYGDRGNSVRQTPDGGYIIAGLTRSFDVGGGDIFVVKTDSNGVSFRRDARVISIENPPGRVYCESTYAVGALVENLGEGPDTFDVTADIDGYADTVRVMGLPPDSIVQITFDDWQAPPIDSVVYRITVCSHAFIDMNPSDDCVSCPVFARTPYHDGKVTHLTLPRDTVIAGSTHAVSAMVVNSGDFIETFDVIASIAEYADTVRVLDLPPHAGEQVTFADWDVPSDDSATYTFTVCARVQEDADTANDCREKLILAREGDGPVMLVARASEGDSAHPGIDEDDYVEILFNKPTNMPNIDPTNIDTVLVLSSDHSWRDGFKNIGGAEWFSERGLRITLSTTVAPPTVAVGDTITSDGFTILDKWRNPTRGSVVVTGSFGPTGTEDQAHSSTPARFVLSQNRPNPFELVTYINYSIPGMGEQATIPVTLTLHDITGKVIRTLVCENREPGFYSTRLEADHLPSGIYFCRLRVGKHEDTRAMIHVE